MNRYNVQLVADFDISADSLDEATAEAREQLVDKLQGGVCVTTIARVFTVIVEEKR